MHDEECRDSHLSLSESITSVLLLGLGMFTVSRGIFWILHPHNTNDSQLYASLDSVMSLSDRKSTRLNSSHTAESRMPSSA